MEHGELVPDATVMMLIRERSRCLHCRGGFMLDGFPRTLAQAEALDLLLAAERVTLDAVLSLELPNEKLIGRLTGRRLCPQCKAVYHLINQKPRVDGVCDQCGARLVQRPDDHPESVCVRLDAYAMTTTPLTDYYRKKGLLVPVSAEGEPSDNLAHALDALAALGLPV